MHTFHFYRLSTGVLLLALLATGCSERKHKQEQRKINQERKEINKSTSDLNDAVVQTDNLAWDSVADYNNFRSLANQRLDKNKLAVSRLKQQVATKTGRIPIRYRKKIRKLQQDNTALRYRLEHYQAYGKANWEDFKALFIYDLEGLETASLRISAEAERR